MHVLYNEYMWLANVILSHVILSFSHSTSYKHVYKYIYVMVYSKINTSIIGYIQGMLSSNGQTVWKCQAAMWLPQPSVPGGALFLVTTEADLKQLLIELTGDLLQSAITLVPPK